MRRRGRASRAADAWTVPPVSLGMRPWRALVDYRRRQIWIERLPAHCRKNVPQPHRLRLNGACEMRPFSGCRQATLAPAAEWWQERRRSRSGMRDAVSTLQQAAWGGIASARPSRGALGVGCTGSGGGFQQLGDLVGRQGAAQQEALHLGAALGLDGVELLLRLHALGGRLSCRGLWPWPPPRARC